MAKTKAQKQIQHLIRQGKLDPRGSRLNWNGINPVTKVRENKKHETLHRDYNRACS
jgi:hypothetical protein